MATKARVKVPKSVKKGEVFQVKTLVSHKMESGQRKDKKTGERMWLVEGNGMYMLKLWVKKKGF